MLPFQSLAVSLVSYKSWVDKKRSFCQCWIQKTRVWLFSGRSMHLYQCRSTTYLAKMQHMFDSPGEQWWRFGEFATCSSHKIKPEWPTAREERACQSQKRSVTIIPSPVRGRLIWRVMLNSVLRLRVGQTWCGINRNIPTSNMHHIAPSVCLTEAICEHCLHENGDMFHKWLSLPNCRYICWSYRVLSHSCISKRKLSYLKLKLACCKLGEAGSGLSGCRCVLKPPDVAWHAVTCCYINTNISKKEDIWKFEL